MLSRKQDEMLKLTVGAERPPTEADTGALNGHKRIESIFERGSKQKSELVAEN